MFDDRGFSSRGSYGERTAPYLATLGTHADGDAAVRGMRASFPVCHCLFFSADKVPGVVIAPSVL